MSIKNQRSLAHYLIDRGLVDAIIGSHAHVIQPYEVYKSFPIIYGMGNLWSGQGYWSKQPRGGIGGVYKLTFIKNNIKSEEVYKFDKFNVTPTYVEAGSWVIYPALVGEKGRNRESNCYALKEFKRVYKLSELGVC